MLLIHGIISSIRRFLQNYLPAWWKNIASLSLRYYKTSSKRMQSPIEKDYAIIPAFAEEQAKLSLPALFTYPISPIKIPFLLYLIGLMALLHAKKHRIRFHIKGLLLSC
ncbi:MAG TPA: hypothetical protein DEP42_01490 [Ruminococcaceae bacterium]|nr:hypothetical protein [Oscillospiraceae bacterium]